MHTATFFIDAKKMKRAVRQRHSRIVVMIASVRCSGRFCHFSRKKKKKKPLSSLVNVPKARWKTTESLAYTIDVVTRNYRFLNFTESPKIAYREIISRRRWDSLGMTPGRHPVLISARLISRDLFSDFRTTLRVRSVLSITSRLYIFIASRIV